MAAGGFSERLAILITADGASAISEFKKVGDSADKDLAKAEDRAARMSAGFTKAGVGMMATSAVMIAGLYNAGQSAAALEQAVGGTEAVFKDASGAIDEFAKASADSAGLSEEQARTLTTRLGGALKGLGFETKAAADQAVNLTKIGADLAATYGGTTAEAVDALGSAFRGEFDPAERFNLFLKQSTVDAKAVAMGLAESTANVDANARAQATLALIVEQSADAQGQFAKEADTTAGAMARAQANMENAKAELGASFTPIMSKAAEVASGLAGAFGAADDATGGLLSSFTAFSAVGLGVAGAISVIIGKAGQIKDQFASAKASVEAWSATKSNVVAFSGALASAATVAFAYHQQLQNLEKQADALGKSFVEVGKEKAGTRGLEGVNAQIAEMNRQMESLFNEVNQWDSTKNPLEKIGGAFMRGPNADMYNEIEAATLELAAYRDEVMRIMNEMGVSEEVAVAYANGLDSAGDAATDADGATAAYAETTESLSKAWSEAEKALKGYLDAQWGMVNAEAAAQEAIDNMLDSLTQSGTFTTDVATPAGRENVEMLQDLQRAALEAGMAEAEKTGSMEAGVAKSQQYAQQLANELIARYGNTQAVRDYIAQLGLTPEQVSTAFQTAGLDEALVKAKDLEAVFGRLAASQFQAAGVAITSKIAGKRADGGPVNAGRSYIVGERGPELFTPGASGTITPNHALPAAGGTQTIVLQIDGREIARAVVDQVRAA